MSRAPEQAAYFQAESSSSSRLVGSSSRTLWGNFGVSLQTGFPIDASSRSVSSEAQQFMHLVAVHILDGVVQCLLHVVSHLMWTRVSNSRGPALALKGFQNWLLVI